jgi:sodium pump decarboxylase gamma subunit
MVNQWYITALGMGTVFLALIVLALIVALFPLIFRRTKAALPGPAPLPALTDRSPGAARGAAGDPALVAAIMAAISAASGMAPSQFRITQIAAAPGQGGFNTPVWGWADRVARAAQTR